MFTVAKAGEFTDAPAQPAVASGSGISTFAVFLLITIPTAVAGFADIYLNSRFTWITGVVFVLTCLLAAVSVRPRDLWTAVITPPIAYLIALLVAGQPSTLSGSGDLLLREGSLVVTGLAFNAPYLFGGTILALIVVLIRRTKLRGKY